MQCCLKINEYSEIQCSEKATAVISIGPNGEVLVTPKQFCLRRYQCMNSSFCVSTGDETTIAKLQTTNNADEHPTRCQKKNQAPSGYSCDNQAKIIRDYNPEIDDPNRMKPENSYVNHNRYCTTHTDCSGTYNTCNDFLCTTEKNRYEYEKIRRGAFVIANSWSKSILIEWDWAFCNSRRKILFKFNFPSQSEMRPKMHANEFQNSKSKIKLFSILTISNLFRH